MTIIEMERENQQGEVEVGYSIGLNYDEEKELAEAVMKLLAEPAFRGVDRDFLETVYWESRARQVPRLWAEDLNRTMDIFEVWSKRGWFECAMPKFLDGNPDVLNNSSAVNMGFRDNTMGLILMIWKDAWLLYREQLICRSDIYKEFAGSKEVFKMNAISHPQSHLTKAKLTEDEFWVEVDRIHGITASTRFPLDRADSYLYVLDYQPRGRDVIPNVLMAHWLKEEPTGHPEEDWVREALDYSVREIERAAELTKPQAGHL